MSYEVKGKVLEIMNVAQISDTFKKREFVLEYSEHPEYPELIQLETIQDKTSLLDSLEIGDVITAHFNLKGRKWTNKEGVDRYFNTLQCWKIDTQTEVAQPIDSSPDEKLDNLPF